MHYAIIAAGEGSRLSSEGITASKPMIPLAGVPLIERLISIFSRHNAESINVIVNSRQPDTLAHIKTLQSRYGIEYIIKDTPSSMHSMYELAPMLKRGTFCMTTVDTLFSEEDFAQYIDRLENCDGDGIMAVTDYIDDEKPLYVGTNEVLDITGFYDSPHDGCRYISGGIYGLKPNALEILRSCVESGQARMRNFQRSLIANGLHLKAQPFGKIIDIDHAGDIIKATEFINQR